MNKDFPKYRVACSIKTTIDVCSNLFHYHTCTSIINVKYYFCFKCMCCFCISHKSTILLWAEAAIFLPNNTFSPKRVFFYPNLSIFSPKIVTLAIYSPELPNQKNYTTFSPKNAAFYIKIFNIFSAEKSSLLL